MEKYDIVLVQPNIFLYYKVKHVPFALVFLNYQLRKAGYRVLLFDQRVDPISKLENAVKNKDLLFVGFSVMTGPVILEALKMSESLKKINNKVKIVFGGPHPTTLPEQTAKHLLVDIAVRGEGEITVLELAKALKNRQDLKTVDGITYKEGENIVSTPDREPIFNWDSEIRYNFEGLDLDNYIFLHKGMKTVHVITSRGCPYRCSFCWNQRCNKSLWRGWSPAEIEKAVNPLVQKGIKYFVFKDDFMGSEKRIMEIGKIMKKLKIKQWAMDNGNRADIHKSEEFFKVLKETNCKHLSYGAESGSPRMLKLLRKNLTPEDLISVAEISAKYGLGIRLGWMIGLPGEKKEDIFMSLDLIDKLNKINPNISHTMSIYFPYPGSESFDEAVKIGYKPPKVLQEWGVSREEAKHSYLKNIWWLRSIYYTSSFMYTLNTDLSMWKKLNPFYSAIARIFKITAKFRWKHRFFDFPIEYCGIDTYTKLNKRIKNLFI